jgi:hypothetical protein
MERVLATNSSSGTVLTYNLIGRPNPDRQLADMVENQQKYKEPLVRVTSVVVPGNGYGCHFGDYRLAKGFLYAYARDIKTNRSIFK